MMSEILAHLKNNEEINTLEFARDHKIDHQEVVGLVKALESKEKVISTLKSYVKIELTDEGKEFTDNGSHEFKVYNKVTDQGVLMTELKEFNAIGFNKAKAFQWIEINSDKMVVRKVDSVIDQVAEDLRDLIKEKILDRSKIKEYKTRKLIKDITISYFLVKKGPKFDEIEEKVEEMLDGGDGEIGDLKFKKRNICCKIMKTGNIHPLEKMKEIYSRIFLNMGFEEMMTNNYVESCFWNFDALFQPQHHPARDAQDTFFLKNPAKSTTVSDNEYRHRVKQVHSNGGYGSLGYRTPWSEEEASKNVFRTHTTAVTARMLYRLASQGEFRPVKYFSIDRVFRNESLDATHLAEFHQVEGMVAARGLTLGHLKGVIATFFEQLGIKKIRFKPAYNPYTEPSMEIFSYHEGLNKWVEIGNSGIFRPEMLLPMGLPEDVVVIAWGLSLERPTMIKYGINNIRDLMGTKMDPNVVYKRGMCRDKM